jgi:crotonobetainyl-CoA:carnitine CoA-transferase CaiB-like acyl-CoA transferase
LYRTQDDGWICVAAITEAQRAALCAALGVERDCDVASLENAFTLKTARFWRRTFDEVGVPNEIPIDTDDGLGALWDADNERLGLVADYEHRVLGRIRQFGTLIDFSATPGRIWGPPPLVGEHTREILRAVDLRDGDIDTLLDAGVVYEPDDALTEYRQKFTN